MIIIITAITITAIKVEATIPQTASGNPTWQLLTPLPPNPHRVPAGAPDAAEGRAGLLDHRRRDRGGDAGGVRGVARRLRVQEAQEGEGDPSAGLAGSVAVH